MLPKQPGNDMNSLYDVNEWLWSQLEGYFRERQVLTECPHVLSFFASCKFSFWLDQEEWLR